MFAVALALRLNPNAHSAPTITAVYLPGYASCALTGVSGDGSTVVGTALSEDASDYEAFQAGFTNTSGGLTWIPYGLGFLSGDDVSTGTAISEDGTAIVGYGGDLAFTADGHPAGLIALGPLDESVAQQCFAFGVAGGGSAIVGSCDAFGLGGNGVAVMWGGNGTLPAPGVQPVSLGFLPGDNLSTAHAVSLSPTRVVGYSASTDGFDISHPTAFLWQGGSMSSLGILSGSTLSFAVAISSNGSTIAGATGQGASASILDGGFDGAFIGTSARVINGTSSATFWRPAQSSLIWTLPVPAGDNYSIATALSADGTCIVGSSGTYDPDGTILEAVVWSGVSLGSAYIYELYSILQNAGTDLSGWSNLTEATGVSSDGDVVVGYGTYNGQQMGFRVAGMRQLIQSPPSTSTVTPSSFFADEAELSNGVYYLAFSNGNYFGYYSFLSDPHYIYHFDLGYEYIFDAADGKNGVYLYDFKSKGFFYTSPTFPFPYLYDFTLKTVLYYYPDTNHAGHYNTNGVRYFYDFATGQTITK